MFKRVLSALLMGLTLPLWAGQVQLPNLDRMTTKHKLEEVMNSHVSHQEFDEEVAQRTLRNFVELTDPAKTYFIYDEIAQWVDPDRSMTEKVLDDYRGARFEEFTAIHQMMGEAIARRNRWEEDLKSERYEGRVDPEDFQDLEWSRSETELRERLLKLRTLREQVTESLDYDKREVALKRVEKRREAFEEDFLTADRDLMRRQVHVNFLKAGATALDSQSAYFTPAEAQQFMIGMQQRLFGIGAQLRDDLNGFTIVKIIEGGPAERGGVLRENDRIIAVDGEPVVGMEIFDAVQLIRGEAGTRVNLTVLRPGAKVSQGKRSETRLSVEVTRGEVVLKETRVETSFEPFGDGEIGYIKLFSFYDDPQFSSSEDLEREIKRMKREHNLKGVVLDLRYNAGGLLSEAVNVTGLFISKGVVVSIMDNAGRVQRLRDTNSSVTWDGPLVVLTNRASASAAEIVAQTLMDYGRAIVVGDETTFGKGTFQTFTLSASGRVHPLGEYKVTRGRYYTVSGRSPQLTGVSPHITVPGPLAYAEYGERFTKYPVPSDRIQASFDDDLEDVPLASRARISQVYHFNLQPRLNDYTSYLQELEVNSRQRIEQNKDYQTFLKLVREDDEMDEENQEMVDDEADENFGKTDLQLAESMNILKDLIYLMLSKPVDSNIAQVDAD